MAKILLGIALAVMLATAALGYLAHQNAEQLQKVLRETKKELGTTKTTLAETRDELKTRTEELAAANTKIEEKEKEIASVKGLLDEANKKIAEGAAAMEAKVTELAALQTKYDELAGKPKDPNNIVIEDPLVAALKAASPSRPFRAASSRSIPAGISWCSASATNRVP